MAVLVAQGRAADCPAAPGMEMELCPGAERPGFGDPDPVNPTTVREQLSRSHPGTQRPQ